MVMPLVTSSENGRGQTEFPLEIGVKMWCMVLIVGSGLVKLNLYWNVHWP
jgi:hypothetical protein